MQCADVPLLVGCPVLSEEDANGERQLLNATVFLYKNSGWSRVRLSVGTQAFVYDSLATVQLALKIIHIKFHISNFLKTQLFVEICKFQISV